MPSNFKSLPIVDVSGLYSADLAARTDASLHPLLAIREEKTVLAFVLTADKGLCGSFNTNIIKAAMASAANTSSSGSRVVTSSPATAAIETSVSR